jgi:hypothetical protein
MNPNNPTIIQKQSKNVFYIYILIELIRIFVIGHLKEVVPAIRGGELTTNNYVDINYRTTSNSNRSILRSFG